AWFLPHQHAFSGAGGHNAVFLAVARVQRVHLPAKLHGVAYTVRLYCGSVPLSGGHNFCVVFVCHNYLAKYNWPRFSSLPAATSADINCSNCSMVQPCVISTAYSVPPGVPTLPLARTVSTTASQSASTVRRAVSVCCVFAMLEYSHRPTIRTRALQ